MSYAAALCSFTSYGPRIRKDIIPSGRGRKRTFSFTKSRLIVEEKGYALDRKGYYTCLSWKKRDMPWYSMRLCP